MSHVGVAEPRRAGRVGELSKASRPPIRRRFSRLASLLELADDEFTAIRSELSAHQRNSRDVINDGNLDIELDQDSLFSFVQSNPQVAILDGIVTEDTARAVNTNVARSYYGTIVERLVAAKFNTVADVSEFMDSNSGILEAFVKEYVPYFEQVWSADDETERAPIPRGMSLHLVGLLRCTLLEGQGDLIAGTEYSPALLSDSRKMLKNALKSIDLT